MWRALGVVVLVVAGCDAQMNTPPPGGAGGGGGGTQQQNGGGTATAGGSTAGGSAAGGSAAGGSAGGAVQSGGGGEDPVDAGPPVDLCPLAEKSCTAHDRKRECVQTAGGTRWSDTTCAVGSGCVRGDCVASACSDECNLGDVSGGHTCQLYDVSTNGWPALDAAAKTHDRARDYNRWLRRDGLIAGGVGSAVYSDPPTYSQLVNVDGIGDSALWTGTYLASEALRLQATGSADARANVRKLAATLHLWLNVSGSPGNLARFVSPSGTVRPYTIPDLDCAADRVHCNTMYQGRAYDYVGHVSRDQYQGVMLGFALAYQALGAEDADVRDLIRTDVVTLVKELMRERQVMVSLKLNGVRLPSSPANVRFIVVNPAEMVNGALDLVLDLGGGGDGDMHGFQEFSPDLADLVHELPGLSWVPPIERPSSAIMLTSFFEVALMMTEGDARFAADHATLQQYFTGHVGKGGNVSDWLTVAKKWAPGTGCSQKYYANNIMMQPLYNLSRLETDPARRADIQGVLFTQKIWPTFSTTKNPFYAFIYAGTVSGVGASVASSAAAQLAQFPAPPRVHRPVDLRNDPRYPHDSQCVDQVDHSTAVDVGDRIVRDFMWQIGPWDLYDPGDLNRTEPGVDYLVAYWLGRKHGFITDDTPTRCLAFR